MMNIKPIGILFLCTAFIVSCAKDKPVITDTGKPVEDAILKINVDNKAGSNDLAIGDTLMDDFGTPFIFTAAKMYLSNFALASEDLQSFAKLTNVDEEHHIGTIFSGDTFDTLKFSFGIDSLINHSDPTVYSATSALYYDASMHWGWSTGYRFLTIEGVYDSDGDGNFTEPFGMHIGTDQLFRNSSLPLNGFTVTPGDNVIDVVVDWRAMLDGVDIVSTPISHSSGAGFALAEQIANNVVNAISTP